GCYLFLSVTVPCSTLFCNNFLLLIVSSFFFSSRRRHTRFSRGWSSDVCSSDLFGSALEPVLRQACGDRLSAINWFRTDWQRGGRSEERRVGKEWRARLGPYQ